MVSAGRRNAARFQGEWGQHSFSPQKDVQFFNLSHEIRRDIQCVNAFICESLLPEKQRDKTVFEISEAFLSQEHSIPELPLLAITFEKILDSREPKIATAIPEVNAT